MYCSCPTLDNKKFPQPNNVKALDHAWIKKRCWNKHDKDGLIDGENYDSVKDLPPQTF